VPAGAGGRLRRVRAGEFRRGDRGAGSPGRAERAYRRQPRAARSDRIHPAEGLSWRAAPGRGRGTTGRTAARRFRRPGCGDRGRPRETTSMTIDVATGIVRILKQEGVGWVSTFPVCRVNNALGRERVPMLMM